MSIVELAMNPSFDVESSNEINEELAVTVGLTNPPFVTSTDVIEAQSATDLNDVYTDETNCFGSVRQKRDWNTEPSTLRVRR
jgi:hypothetical protein